MLRAADHWHRSMGVLVETHKTPPDLISIKLVKKNNMKQGFSKSVTGTSARGAGQFKKRKPQIPPSLNSKGFEPADETNRSLRFWYYQ